MMAQHVDPVGGGRGVDQVLADLGQRRDGSQSQMGVVLSMAVEAGAAVIHPFCSYIRATD